MCWWSLLGLICFCLRHQDVFCSLVLCNKNLGCPVLHFFTLFKIPWHFDFYVEQTFQSVHSLRNERKLAFCTPGSIDTHNTVNATNYLIGTISPSLSEWSWNISASISKAPRQALKKSYDMKGPAFLSCSSPKEGIRYYFFSPQYTEGLPMLFNLQLKN